ncbi:hypothetical protein D9M72_488150 [compost metagenome]
MAGVDEVAFGLDGIVLDVRSNDAVWQLGVLDAVVVGLDVIGKVLTDEAIEQGAEDVLLEIPAIDCAADIVGDFPYLASQDGALFGAGHIVFPVSIFWFGSSMRLEPRKWSIAFTGNACSYFLPSSCPSWRIGSPDVHARQSSTTRNSVASAVG